ncbi:MAG: APC family permease [Phycisphaerales bacterium]|nr:APC family permease [Phycisphaerales bacterium]
MSKPSDHQQERVLGLGSATSVVVAAMIGSGIFFTTGEIGASLVTPGNVLLVWLICGLLTLCGALTLGELGAMLPHAGGIYVYVKKAFGRFVGCFIGLETALLATPCGLAIISLATGNYLAKLLPWMPPWLTAIGAIIIITCIHCMGTTFGALVNNIGAVLKVLLLASFILLGLVLPSPEIAPTLLAKEAPSIFSSQFAEAIIIVNFAFVGWAIVTNLGGEIRRPNRNIPLSVLGGVTLVTVIYLLMNIVFLRAVPPEQMINADGQPTSTLGYMVAERLFPTWIADSLGWLIVLLMLSTILSVVLSGARMAYAMSHAGQMPMRFSRLSRRGSPIAALLLQATITILLIIAFDIRTLLLFAGLLGMFSFALMMGSTLILRRTASDLERPFRIPLYPLPPLISIGVAMWLAWHIATTSKGAVLFTAIVVVIIGLLAAVVEYTQKSSRVETVTTLDDPDGSIG